MIDLVKAYIAYNSQKRNNLIDKQQQNETN